MTATTTACEEPVGHAPQVEATAPSTEPASLERGVDTAAATPAGWPALSADHALFKFQARLPSILAAAGHDKIWGVTLKTEADFATWLVLQKFLRSVSGELEAAAAALQKTLTWRKEFGLDAGAKHTYGPEFDGLGYVTKIQPGGRDEVVTWNLYGATADLSKTFGDLDQFLHWRVDLMERAMAAVDLAHATEAIPDSGAGEDPHRMAQVHVYTGVSFLRLDPHVKAASKATIQILGTHYPETLSRKLFVGVPLLMSWVYSAVTMFVSAQTVKKFVVVSYESNTARVLGDEGSVPTRFGGTGKELAELDLKV